MYQMKSQITSTHWTCTDVCRVESNVFEVASTMILSILLALEGQTTNYKQKLISSDWWVASLTLNSQDAQIERILHCSQSLCNIMSLYVYIIILMKKINIF